MSIRLRLTLLYSAILVATLLLFGVALYVTVSRVTINVVEETLAQEADRIVDSRKFRLDDIDYHVEKLAAPQTYVQTIRLDGDVIDRTAGLGEYTLPLSREGRRTCRSGKPWTEVSDTEDGRLLIYSRPVRENGDIVGILQLARSLADYDQSLETLRRILLLGGGIVTLLAVGSGWILAGTVLQPIDRITTTAHAIGAERDFDQRVDYEHAAADDEVGRLARTFNNMLEELQAAYTQVEETLQQQRRFIADASHELRTPLTTIRGNLELLRRHPPISEADRAAVLDDVVDESDRLIRLVNDLLVLARADSLLATQDSTGQPLEQESVALKPLVDELCRQVRQLAPDRTVRCDEITDVAVAGDRDAVKQVLLILLDNALQYSDGPIRVTIEERDGDVAITVHDEGPGIAPDLLPHIFERFYQGDSARTGSSAGLGLSIAKTLTEAQGGTIDVASAVGKGSTFTVTLPAA